MQTGCHFLTQVKSNCSRLFAEIALFTALSRPISSCEYYDDKHGYQANRCVELYENKVQLPKNWQGIKRFVKVRRWGTRQQCDYHEVSFYILSKPINSAALVAKAIQGHWSIENNLHWIKDVNLGEDDMSIRQTQMAAIVAYMNNVAINVLKNAGMKPTKDNLAKISNKVYELHKLFDST